MATRFGRAGGNWSASGTWSASSGGASDGSGIGAGDVVILDSNSSGTFTIDTTISIASLDCSGTGGSGTPFAGTLVQNGVTLSVSALLFKLVAGMTFAPASSARLITFTSTSGTTLITTAGKTLGAVTFNGVGGTFQNQDAMAVRSDASITLTNGTWDTNSKNISAGNILSNNSNTRVLTMGASAIALACVSVGSWDFTVGTGATITANTATVTMSPTTVGQRQFVGGSLNFNGLTVAFVSAPSLSSSLLMTGSPTIANLTLSGAGIGLQFQTATTTTITGAINWSGSKTGLISIMPSSFTGTAATVALSSAGNMINWASINTITFTTNGVTATNSFDMGSNTLATITAPQSSNIIA
jgi:hypothetical protein